MVDDKLIALFNKSIVTDEEFVFICNHNQVNCIEYTPSKDELNKIEYWIETIDDEEHFIYKETYIEMIK
jgi:hypothetical protein